VSRREGGILCERRLELGDCTGAIALVVQGRSGVVEIDRRRTPYRRRLRSRARRGLQSRALFHHPLEPGRTAGLDVDPLLQGHEAALLHPKTEPRGAVDDEEGKTPLLVRLFDFALLSVEDDQRHLDSVDPLAILVDDGSGKTTFRSRKRRSRRQHE